MDEIEKHRAINLKFMNSFWLFWQHTLCGTNFCCTREKNLTKSMKLYHLYMDGKNRVNNELDIVKILSKLRTHDIAIKSTILDS